MKINRFLYERFPNSYGRIYKAILQNKGKDLIPKIYKTFDDISDAEKFMESQDLDHLPHDVFVGIRDIFYIKKCGYWELISHIFKKNQDTKLTNEMDAIVLQIHKSERWQGRYHSTDKQYDLILGIPKWSRVVAMSTSDIEPASLVKRINQFDTIRFQNYHFYEMFNKMHGVSGRNVTILENTSDEKAESLSHLNFLLRTSEDIKTLSHSKNLRLFTLIPDINGLARIGFHFSMVGKVTKIGDIIKKDKTGIDPYSYAVHISDNFSTIQMNLDSDNFVSSANKLYLANEINRFFGSADKIQIKFEHPSEMVDYDGYVLLIGVWFLGDDSPGISYIIPLNKDIHFLKYQLIGFMNTHRKQNFQSVNARFEMVLDGKKEIDNIVIDAEKKWVYFKEDSWDKNIFQMMVERKFERPEFSELLKMDISRLKLKEWTEYTNIYFQINEFIKDLYISDDPEAEFEKAYPTFEQETHPEIDFEKEPGHRQIPSLILVKSWSQVYNIIPKLKKSNYTIDEIFTWNNGGKVLQNKIEKYFFKVTLRDEFVSYLRTICSARGGIYLPEDIVLSKIF